MTLKSLGVLFGVMGTAQTHAFPDLPPPRCEVAAVPAGEQEVSGIGLTPAAPVTG